MKFVSANTCEWIVKKDYKKQIILKSNDFIQDGHLLQIVIIPPNTKQRVHSHDIQTEVFYILEGECTITINGTNYLAKPGDAFICSPGDNHNLWNKTDKDFKLLVFKIDLPDSEDTNWNE
jgi:quercetin dioxygenase-like cupin family protein